MGRMVPPPVRPRPAAASSSVRVVVTMMEAGSPLCWPSFPDANSALSAALSASWLRWAGPRVSLSIAAWVGVPSTHGLSSSGLHMPGAASLANTASTVARVSGVSQPRNFGHAVGVLVAQRDAASAGAVVVGVGAVGVEPIGQALGQLGELFGAKLRPVSGQLGFGVLAGREIHPARAAGGRTCGSPPPARRRSCPPAVRRRYLPRSAVTVRRSVLGVVPGRRPPGCAGPPRRG